MHRIPGNEEAVCGCADVDIGKKNYNQLANFSATAYLPQPLWLGVDGTCLHLFQARATM